MGEKTAIGWTDHTFNGWVGCTRVSPACDNCYAAALAKRTGMVEWDGPPRRTSPENWRQPIKWDRKAQIAGKRAKVFCLSLGDWLDNQAPDEWRQDLARLIRITPMLDWLLLTKRPQNYLKHAPWHPDQIPANVWLGVTAENRPEYQRRVSILRGLPASVRFLSIEPLLEDLGNIDLAGIGWVIAGGESGPKSRPMHPDWARSLRDQCAAAGVPFFFKQWGEHLPVGQSLPGCGKVHGATAVKPGRMKLHYGGTSQQEPKHAFAERGVEFASTTDGRLTFRVGKKAAGRLLDGREHNDSPAVV